MNFEIFVGLMILKKTLDTSSSKTSAETKFSEKDVSLIFESYTHKLFLYGNRFIMTCYFNLKYYVMSFKMTQFSAGTQLNVTTSFNNVSLNVFIPFFFSTRFNIAGKGNSAGG